MAQGGITIRVRAWAEDGRGDFRQYFLPVSEQMDVLSALEHIHAHLDPAVAYRSACRRGVCSGCRMLIDGELLLACETEVKAGMEIDPYAAK